MTLMDAPRFDEVGSRRRSVLLKGSLVGLLALFIASWLVVGHPLDSPWTWWTYWSGTRATNGFLHAVEGNDMPRAYGIWVNDKNWQQHAGNFKTYPYERFLEDWGPNSSANDYGTIASHQIVVQKVVGTELVVGSMINGRKSKPLFLAYDRSGHTLGFSPVELTVE
jgi:hypothetical protein